MEKVIINCYEDFQNYLGKEIGVSEYLTVDQARINLFADATLDHQWIHTDEERCRRESPFGQTIAHGYLTLSLLPYLWDEIIQVNNLECLVNYGLDRLKFGQPVLSGQAIRLRTELVELANLRGAIKMSMHFVIEIRETGKKAVEGVSTFVYYFKKQ